jgi:Fe(3+) dicitrate transport protein
MTDGWRELLAPLLDPGQRTYLPLVLGSLVAGLVALMVTERLGVRAAWARVRDGLLAPRLWRHRSAVLDVQLTLAKALLRALGLVPWTVGAVGVASATARAMAALGSPGIQAPPGLVTALYSFALFVAWDGSRYLVHRLMHTVPALWELHQVHHSAEVLTPLTHHRTHPLESALYAARGGLVTGLVAGAFLWAFGAAAQPLQLLGVGALGFALNGLGGNLRHSHVWIAYGAVEGWLISPAQHQLHHELGGGRTNYGAWLAVWDRLGDTLQTSGARRELTFGIAAAERNHAPDDLLGALVQPLRAGARRLVPRPAWALGALLLVPWVALADDEGEPSGDGDEPAGDEAPEGEGEPSPPPPAGDDEPPSPSPDDDGARVDATVEIVERRGRTPRVAGSAHVIDAQELERFENDDIHRVLAPVPGVYVRDEDGMGLRPNIGLRGANSDRSAKITLEEDGVLLAPAPYAAPAAYYFPLTTRLVGVEVFKGPSATSHGPHTVGGAVNLQTRPVPASGATGGADIAFGTYDTLKLHAHTGVGGPVAGAVIEGVLLRSDGFKELDGGGATGFLKGEVMAKGRLWSPRDRPTVAGVELKLGYAGERSEETYLGLSDADFAEDPDRRYAASQLGLMRWTRGQAELAWTLRHQEALDVRVVGYYHTLNRSWRKLNRFAGGPALHDLLLGDGGGQAAVFLAVLRGDEDSAGADQTLLIGTNARVFHAGGVQARARWRASLGKVDNELELGLRVHRDQIARTHDEQGHAMRSGALVPLEDAPVVVTENVHSASAVAMYITDELAIGPLRVLPGVRLEIIRTEARDLLASDASARTEVVGLPGIGVHVQPLPWLSVLGGLHRGFSPSAPGSAVGTKPESSWNAELGARLDHRGLGAEVIGFFNHYENLTGQCTFSGGCADDQLGEQFNAGQVEVYGVEALVSHELLLPAGFGLRGRLSYTFTGSTFATTFVSGFPQFGLVEAGDALPYVPAHQGAATLGFTHPFGHIELAAKAQSAMRDVAGQGVIADTEKLPAFLVLDLAVDVQLSRFATLYATVNNLTNSRTMVSRRPFGARPGRPFHVMVGAKLRF